MSRDEAERMGADGKATSKPVAAPDPLAAELLAAERDLLTAGSSAERQAATTRRDHAVAQIQRARADVDRANRDATAMSKVTAMPEELAKAIRERDEARELALMLLEYGNDGLRYDTLPEWAGSSDRERRAAGAAVSDRERHRYQLMNELVYWFILPTAIGALVLYGLWLWGPL